MTEQATKTGSDYATIVKSKLKTPWGISLLVLIVGSFLGYFFGKSRISQFTDTEPMPVPMVQMSQPELTQLRHRIATFSQALKAGEAVEPLSISADEANALVAATPELVTVNGRLHFWIEGTNVLAQVSIPANDLGLRPLRGRYVNATGNFTVAFSNATLNVNLQSLSARGRQFPDNFMRHLRPQNFAYKLNHDPKTQAVLNKLADVQIKDGRVLIVPKKRP